MSKRIRVVLTQTGPAEIRCSPEAVEMVKSIADNAVALLGEGHAATVRVTGGPPIDNNHPRAVAKVSAVWNQTKAANARDNTLLKAVKRSGKV